MRDSISALQIYAVKLFVEYYVRSNYLKNISINFNIFLRLEFFQTGPCAHNEGIWEWKFSSTNSYLCTRWEWFCSFMPQSFYHSLNIFYYRLGGFLNRIGRFEDELSPLLLQIIFDATVARSWPSHYNYNINPFTSRSSKLYLPLMGFDRHFSGILFFGRHRTWPASPTLRDFVILILIQAENITEKFSELFPQELYYFLFLTGHIQPALCHPHQYRP